MKFIIENSKTPIYDRIARAIASGLIELGHEVLFIDAHDFTSSDFIRTINDLSIDFYISTNALNYIQKYDETLDDFLFSHISHKKIFIYHDSSIAELSEPVIMLKKIQQLILMDGEIFHFCIEQSTIDLLKSFGIKDAYKIYHASEFHLSPKDESELNINTTFVGHLTSTLDKYPLQDFPYKHHLLKNIYSRLTDSSAFIQPNIIEIAQNEQRNKKHFFWYPKYQELMHYLARLTMPFRAELLKILNPNPITIIGGDLSNGFSNDEMFKLNDSHITYSPATENYNDTSNIYNTSKINLNISSLQFDTGFNNRIVDIFCSAGFGLTDMRSDLQELIPDIHHVTFSSPEDLKEKIFFYNSNDKSKKYQEIKFHLISEFQSKLNYPKILSSMIEKLK